MHPKFECSFWFPTLLAVLLLLDSTRPLLPVLAAIFLHETGHLIAFRLLGVPIERIRLMPFGIEITRRTAAVRAEWFLYLAGPLMNLLCSLLYSLFGGRWLLHAAIHIVVFGFNLLPIVPLDGGNLLAVLLQRWFLPDRAEFWQGIAAVAILLPLCFFSLLFWQKSRNPTLPITCGYLVLKVVFRR